MQIQNISQFDDPEVLSELPLAVRLLRGKSNNTLLFTSGYIELLASPAILSVTIGITSLRLIAYSDIVVTEISTAEVSDGTLVYLYFDSDGITIAHGVGNIFLSGDPSLPDLPAVEGDMLLLIYANGIWKEVSRTLVRATGDDEAWSDDEVWDDSEVWGDTNKSDVEVSDVWNDEALWIDEDIW